MHQMLVCVFCSLCILPCFMGCLREKVCRNKSSDSGNSEGCTVNLTSCSVSIDYGVKLHPINHFWESTGLSPPGAYENASTFLLSKDMHLNLALIGALPRKGVMQVRIHWLLNLISIQEITNTTLIYNFKQLDKLIDILHRNGLKPGFEIMGNPSNYFSDLENKAQIYQWCDMVKTIAKRYIGIYSLDYVKEWNFESWNEPDHGDFNGLNFTIQGFLNYYDACSEGLRLAHPLLKLGGPAESFRGKFINFSWQLLDHCINGINFFTGEKGVRIDFISMHEKGNATSFSIVEEELTIIKEIHEKFPSLRDVPIYNDEGDPLVGWWKSEIWRAHNKYAGLVVKIIDQHQLTWTNQFSNVSGWLLSNDNGFLNFYPSFFEQRTLMTRFQMNNTTPHRVQMIRKPVYAALGLMSLLGSHLVSVNISADNSPNKCQNVGGLASYTSNITSVYNSWDAGIIIYNCADMDDESNDINLTISINLQNILNGVEYKNLKYVWYKMDNKLTSPYHIWMQLGKPVFPQPNEFREMRLQEDPHRLSKPKTLRSLKSLLFNHILPEPGLLLLHICEKSYRRPGKVTGIQIHPISNTDVLFTWKNEKVATKCLLTYEVQFSKTIMKGNFHRINKKDTIFHSFHYSVAGSQNYTERLHGYYRIRAVDYWHRSGKWSKLVLYFPK